MQHELIMTTHIEEKCFNKMTVDQVYCYNTELKRETAKEIPEVELEGKRTMVFTYQKC